MFIKLNCSPHWEEKQNRNLNLDSMIRWELTYYHCPGTTTMTKHPSGSYHPNQSHKDTTPVLLMTSSYVKNYNNNKQYMNLPPTILHTTLLPGFGTMRRDWWYSQATHGTCQHMLGSLQLNRPQHKLFPLHEALSGMWSLLQHWIQPEQLPGKKYCILPSLLA